MGYRLILVDLRDRLFDRADPRCCLLGGLLCLIGAIAGIHRVSVGVVGFAHRLANAFGRPGVHIGDHLRVLGREFIQLVHATTNRVELAVDILLAGKGVDFPPEALVTFVLQRLMTRAGLLLVGALDLLLGRSRLLIG